MTAKQTTLTREISAVVYICDKCGEEIKYDFFHPKSCRVCGRHFHLDCDFHMTNEYGASCGECWAIGEPFRERMRVLEQSIEQVRNDWYNLAREKATSKQC